VVTGSDIRRYRKSLGMNQTAFARQFGLAQPTLSQIERGRTGVSREHIEALVARFDAPRTRPAFREFLELLEVEKAGQQAALLPPQERHSILPVWDWEEGFDLSRRPEAARAVDLLTVCGSVEPAIALRMPRKKEWWEAGEMFVFERCGRDDLRDADVCLLQVQISRSRNPRTAIAVAHVVPAKRGHLLQYGPVSPAGPFIRGEDEAVLAVLRATFRGRRLS
jgi:transcriptional regulator with XRE-family HTH domain